ncbi:unnamed protein product [Lactuca saligna]|uniref:Uncharacterized protein n=1 Tax=Lactuca saligna TaxID=75948 RepID=A0AA35ZTR1_LACSI|nr:unnamed protein product [Lactuca saligna]
MFILSLISNLKNTQTLLPVSHQSPPLTVAATIGKPMPPLTTDEPPPPDPQDQQRSVKEEKEKLEEGFMILGSKRLSGRRPRESPFFHVFIPANLCSSVLDEKSIVKYSVVNNCSYGNYVRFRSNCKGMEGIYDLIHVAFYVVDAILCWYSWHTITTIIIQPNKIDLFCSVRFQKRWKREISEFKSLIFWTERRTYEIRFCVLGQSL